VEGNGLTAAHREDATPPELPQSLAL